jgi:hypothetical protein
MRIWIGLATAIKTETATPTNGRATAVARRAATGNMIAEIGRMDVAELQ